MSTTAGAPSARSATAPASGARPGGAGSCRAADPGRWERDHDVRARPLRRDRDVLPSSIDAKVCAV